MEALKTREVKSNRALSLWEALIPVIALIALLAFNVYVFGDDAVSGSNQFILLIGGAVAGIVGYFNNTPLDSMLEGVAENIKSVFSAILILLLVGSLAASWLVSGIIPAMIYYGLELINPVIFLPTAVIISAIISLATGSSWTTSATIGIALIAIGKAMGMHAGMVAGAVISGAYFGDKMSPLSDTTNLAAAMANTKLFTHIRYMAFTTVPSIVITLIIFSLLSINQDLGTYQGADGLLTDIASKFVIHPLLFVVPVIIILLIVRKVNPIVALLVGTLLGCVAAWIAQPDLFVETGRNAKYKFLMHTITQGVSIETSNASLNDLFTSGGMKGMLGTVWLIICAMVFGGIMEAIGALNRISSALLKLATSVFGLFASTVASCLAINLTASDQYLAIVVPGKMFQQAYKDRDLAPENLSRTLEDSGTVTSALIPWNTCGAYQSGVLGVGVGEYFAFAFFNYISPFMTLLYAAFSIKIRSLHGK